MGASYEQRHCGFFGKRRQQKAAQHRGLRPNFASACFAPQPQKQPESEQNENRHFHVGDAAQPVHRLGMNGMQPETGSGNECEGFVGKKFGSDLVKQPHHQAVHQNRDQMKSRREYSKQFVTEQISKAHHRTVIVPNFPVALSLIRQHGSRKQLPGIFQAVDVRVVLDLRVIVVHKSVR